MTHDANDALEVVLHALDRYRVTKGAKFDLSDHDTGDLPDGLTKKEGKRLLENRVARLSELQEKLYADRRWSLLIVLQAMDAGGKDSTIKHVMSGVNPQGVSVTSFKQPSSTELAHGFLWRVSRALPPRGGIGIFNRSHYEDVVVTRVHPELVKASGLPPDLADAPHFWEQRLADISSFESYLGRQGTRVVKFFLHLGRDKQRKRFLKRIETSDKQWKFAAADIRERQHWDAYQRAYAAAIAGTASSEAPWFVIPADRKWFMRLAVAEAIIKALEDLPLMYPEPTAEARKQMAEAEESLRRH